MSQLDEGTDSQVPEMSESDQVQALSDELDALIDHYRAEFDLTYASVVGVLHMKQHLLCVESECLMDEDEE